MREFFLFVVRVVSFVLLFCLSFVFAFVSCLFVCVVITRKGEALFLTVCANEFSLQSEI